MIEEKTQDKSQPPSQVTNKNEKSQRPSDNQNPPPQPPLPPGVSAPPLPPNTHAFGQRNDSFSEEMPGSNHLDDSFESREHFHPPSPEDAHRNRSSDRHTDRDRNRYRDRRDSRHHYDERENDSMRRASGDRRDRHKDRHHHRHRHSRERDRETEHRYDDHVSSRDSRDSRKYRHQSHYRNSRYMDDRDRDHRRRSRDRGDFRRRHGSSDWEERRDQESEHEEGELPSSDHRDSEVSLPPEPPPADAIPEPPPPEDDAPPPPEPDADGAHDEPRLDLDSRIQSLLGGFAPSPEREPETPAPPLPPGGDAPPLPPSDAPPLPSDPPPMPPHPGVNGDLQSRLDQFSKVFMANGVAEDDRMSLSSGHSGEQDRIELHPSHLPPPPMPPPPMGMPPMPPPLPMWSTANSSNPAFPAPVPPHPLYSHAHGFMQPPPFIDPHQQALMQQRQLETFTEMDRDAEKTFMDVLDEVIDQLKTIMKKDLCKKMLQGTAFKTFDAWYDQETRKKNQVRLCPCV